jgi:hypothetical protein
LIEVAALFRDLQPVVHGLDGHLVQLLPLLLIVLHFLGVAVVQTVTVKGQVEFLLVGQFVKDIGLVGRGDVEEGLEAVGVGWVVEDEEF